MYKYFFFFLISSFILLVAILPIIDSNFILDILNDFKNSELVINIDVYNHTISLNKHSNEILKGKNFSIGSVYIKYLFKECFDFVKINGYKLVNNGRFIIQLNNINSKDLLILFNNCFFENKVVISVPKDCIKDKNYLYISKEELYPYFFKVVEINSNYFKDYRKIIINIPENIKNFLSNLTLKVFLINENRYKIISYNISINNFVFNSGMIDKRRLLELTNFIPLKLYGFMNYNNEYVKTLKFEFELSNISKDLLISCKYLYIFVNLDPRIGIFFKKAFIRPFSKPIQDFLKNISFSGNIIEDLKRIVEVVNKRFKYVDDIIFGREDYWLFPEEVLKIWKGDCEDWSNLILSLFLAYDYNIECYVCYGLKNNGIGHSFVVCYLDKVYLFDQNIFKEFNSLNELLNYENIKRLYGCYR